MGHDPQVKEVLYTCNVDNNPLFIGKFHHEEITVEPIVPSPVLYAKSKLTDLIYIWHIGFSFTKLISGKLMAILEKYKKTGLQFFQCSIIHNNVEYKDYHPINVYEFNMEMIDFAKSKINVRVKKKTGGTQMETLTVNSFDEFENALIKHKKNMEIVTIEKTELVNEKKIIFSF